MSLYFWCDLFVISLGENVCCMSVSVHLQVVAVTDYAEGELFQILEDDGQLPEEQVHH